jgi:hypothetical protein
MDSLFFVGIFCIAICCVNSLVLILSKKGVAELGYEWLVLLSAVRGRAEQGRAGHCPAPTKFPEEDTWS